MAHKHKPPPPKKKVEEPKKVNIPWKLILLIVVAVGLVSFPYIKWYRCKLACMERLTAKDQPYPEIACKYECPLPLTK